MVAETRTCALVAASDFNAVHFRQSAGARAFDQVIALDAGYAHVMRAGFTPDRVIGDFDSLGYVPEVEDVEVFPTHKDKSDLEIGFDYARDAGFHAVCVYGALGGRLDHTLANLQIAAHFAEQGIDVRLIGPEYAVQVLVGPGKFDLPRLEQGTVSVFSATDESSGVTERGLEYSLENASLTNRTTLGVSNELVGQPASVSLQRGTLYVIHPLP